MRRTLISGLMEYGASKRAQASLEAPYVSLDRPSGGASGIGDMEAGILYDVTPWSSRDSFAGALDVKLPTGDEARGVGQGETAWRASALATRRRGRTEVHVNVSQLWGGEKTGTRVDAALVVAQGRWRPLLEVTGLGTPGVDKFITPGVFYKTWSDVEWGVAFPVGVVRKAPKDGVILKVLRVFGGRRS